MSSTLSQNLVDFGPQTAENWAVILPTIRKFYILLHCQAPHTDVSKQNSTKICQTWTANRAQSAVEKSGSSLLKNGGGGKNYAYVVFSTTLRLDGQYRPNETRHKQSEKSFEKYKGSLPCFKIL